MEDEDRVKEAPEEPGMARVSPVWEGRGEGKGEGGGVERSHENKQKKRWPPSPTPKHTRTLAKRHHVPPFTRARVGGGGHGVGPGDESRLRAVGGRRGRGQGGQRLGGQGAHLGAGGDGAGDEEGAGARGGGGGGEGLEEGEGGKVGRQQAAVIFLSRGCRSLPLPSCSLSLPHLHRQQHGRPQQVGGASHGAGHKDGGGERAVVFFARGKEKTQTTPGH